MTDSLAQSSIARIALRYTFASFLIMAIGQPIHGESQPVAAEISKPRILEKAVAEIIFGYDVYNSGSESLCFESSIVGEYPGNFVVLSPDLGREIGYEPGEPDLSKNEKGEYQKTYPSILQLEPGKKLFLKGRVLKQDLQLYYDRTSLEIVGVYGDGEAFVLVPELVAIKPCPFSGATRYDDVVIETGEPTERLDFSQ